MFAGFAFGLAVAYAAAGAIVVWLATGDRQTWAERGPHPFDEFGSGPFLVWFAASFAAGALLLAAAAVLAARRTKLAVVTALVGVALPILVAA